MEKRPEPTPRSTPELSVADFFAFGSAAARRTAEDRIRMAEAGIVDRSDRDGAQPAA